MLIELLQDIVSSEYAQWMRYTYLSSLSFGLHTDALSEEFHEHASDELEHAETISRWIVDLGGVPPTSLPMVEQFCGSTEEAILWLIEAEIIGIEKYNLAHTICLGMPGLQADIGEILQKEHEHLSNLTKLISPHFSEGDSTIVIVASSYAKFKNCGSYYKIASIKKQADTLQEYLKELLELAAYKYLHEYNPNIGYVYILNDIKTSVERLWSERGKEDIQTALTFYRDLNEWINSEKIRNDWDNIHNVIWPDWQQWLQSDTEQIPIEEEQQPSYQQIMEGVEPPLAPEEPEEEAAIPEQMSELQMMEELLGEELEEDPSRREMDQLVEEAPEGYIIVLDPRSQKPSQSARKGDEIYNQQQKSKGTIKKVLTDDTVVVETPNGDEATWDPNQEKIYLSAR